MKNISELISEPNFNLDSFERFLYTKGYMCYTRSYAYSFAKELRSKYPLCFTRVLKVGRIYFVITDEDDYKLFWNVRKIAMRNERKKKNETL